MPPKRAVSTSTPTTAPTAAASTAPPTAPTTVSTAAPAAAPVPTEKEKKGKGRAKKAIQVVAIVTPAGIEGTFTPEPRKPLICHLPFESKEVKFNEQPLVYDPTPPVAEIEGYGNPDTSYFGVETTKTHLHDDETTYPYADKWMMEHKDEAGAESNTSADGGAAAVTTMSTSAAPMVGATPSVVATASGWKTIGENYHRYELMKAFKNGAAFEIPDTTPYNCFWCSFEVEGKPCFLPMREEKGAFHIYGNFCSPQCALAFLLQENIDPHVRWERMALLHRMYKPRAGGRLYPAPPRESLAMFGGPYEKEQFRQILNENTVRVDIQMPPLVSILGSLDTKPIDFYDSSLQNTFTQGLNAIQERFGKPTEGPLRLKRSKPLMDKESTLDSCFQIQVKSGVGRAGVLTV